MSEEDISSHKRKKYSHIQSISETCDGSLEWCLNETNAIERAEMKWYYLKSNVDLEMEKLHLTECLLAKSDSSSLPIEDMSRYDVSCDTVQGAQDTLAEAKLELDMARQELEYQREHPEGKVTAHKTALVFIEHLQAGRIVEEWYDVPVHYFKTIQDVARKRKPVVHPNPDNLDEFLNVYTNKTDISGITGAARNAAVECVKMPFLRCTDPAFLFNNSTPLLLVRSQYITLCNELLAHPVVPNSQHPDVFVLDGDEGTGKTFFLYYFMYRLHNRTNADGSPRPMSYRGENVGSQNDGASRGMKPSASMKKAGRYYDWGVFDNFADFEPCNCRSILMVTYETAKLRDPKKFLTDEEGTGTTRYYSMSPLSYAETCAIAFCPRLVNLSSSPVTLPIGVSQISPEHASGDNGNSNVAPPVAHTTDLEVYKHRLRSKFRVLHPMYILAHFVCFRSSLWSLLQGRPICYTTPGPDGRVNARNASVPQFLFLKRSVDSSGIGLVPYTPYQSVFDYTLGEMSCLRVSDDYAMGEGVDSSCGLTERPASTRTGRVDTDASQLTSLGPLEPRFYTYHDDYYSLHEPFYRGFALDLAKSMHTSTSDKQFRKVLASILPFACTVICGSMGGAIHKAQDAAAQIQRKRHNLDSFYTQERDPDECLTLRHHADIVHTEPVNSRDYNNHMHQHLTVLTADTASSSDFIYLYRTRAIKNTVNERIRQISEHI
jgi:hypothetical protein